MNTKTTTKTQNWLFTFIQTRKTKSFKLKLENIRKK